MAFGDGEDDEVNILPDAQILFSPQLLSQFPFLPFQLPPPSSLPSSSSQISMYNQALFILGFSGSDLILGAG
ncbi:hypothetical protein J1N35_007124 [Gossypium stocksii]|uniref:Uncharacterized protein n=1 Tax=Gossypium stocksii TaxID=47602 RepID=A0A9D4AF83_9ROSI|nr:hypothetical protein J1N35_007124 [Gossypium stocksii]